MHQLSADSFLLPLDRELPQRVDWFIRLRWLAGTAVVAIGSILPVLGIPFPAIPVCSIGAAVLLYNLVLYRRRETMASSPALLRQAIYLQIALDWGALICTMHLTGGIGSPFSLVFVFHLIIGAFLLSRRACYFLSGTASAVLGLLAMLSAAGVVRPFALFGWSEGADLVGAHRIWLGLTVFFFITTYLSTSITARLREGEAALARSERALDLAYREMEALYELGKVVNSTLDLNEVLSLIAENATRLLHAKASFVRLFDKSGKKLYVGGWYGLSQAYVNKGPVEVEKSQVDFEVLHGEMIQVLDVAQDERFQYREEARREGLRSMLSCPIRAKNRSVGVIRVYTAEPHVFSEQQGKLLLNMANLGAVAIQNARSYGELLALDEERVWFARTTHHQLRSPLAAAQGALDAMSYAGSLNETQQDLVRRAKRRIQDSFDMIKDLLDLAASQRLEDAVLAEPVRFDEALKRVLETAREQARAKGLSFVEELADGDSLLMIQPADLERIFSNLLNNAVKYTCCGEVVFGARREDGWLEAWVTDTGIGIAREELEKVFKGFYRTAAAKATGEVGTGLGLSIVRHVVEKVGGAVSVDSEQGKGARFNIRLPLAPS